ADRAEVPPPAERADPPTLPQVRDAWPEVLEVVKKASRADWTIVFTATPRAFADGVLTLGFPAESQVAKFKQANPGGDSVSEQLRTAIHQVLGVRVRFLARHEPTQSAPEPAPAEEADPPAEPAPVAAPAEKTA